MRSGAQPGFGMRRGLDHTDPVTWVRNHWIGSPLFCQWELQVRAKGVIPEYVSKEQAIWGIFYSWVLGVHPLNSWLLRACLRYPSSAFARHLGRFSNGCRGDQKQFHHILVLDSLPKIRTARVFKITLFFWPETWRYYESILSITFW